MLFSYRVFPLFFRRVRYSNRMSERQKAVRLEWAKHHIANKTDFRNWVFSDEKWFFLVIPVQCL